MVQYYTEQKDSQLALDRFISENLILNPEGGIAEYGTSVDNPTSAAEYNCVDRWRCRRAADAGNCRFGQSSIPDINSTNSIFMRRNTGDTNTNTFIIQQQIENRFIYGVRGKKLTLTFKLQSDAEWISDWSTTDVKLATGTNTTESIAIGSTATGEVELINITFNAPDTADTWQKYTFTTDVVVPSDAGTMYLKFRFGTSGTASADVLNRITEIKLEIGEQPTPYVARPYTTEQYLCRRYFEKLDLNAGLTGAAYSTNTVRGYLAFVPKRVVPTITDASIRYYLGGWQTPSNVTIGNTTTGESNITLTTSGVSAAEAFILDGFVYVDSEL